MRITQCEIGTVGWLEPNILLVDIDGGKEIGVEHVSEFYYKAAEIAKDTKVYSIINYGAFSYQTREAIELCNSNEPSNHILARAIVVNDLGQFITAKHTVKRLKSKVPVQVFNNIDQAKTWVKSLKSNHFENQTVVL